MFYFYGQSKFALLEW